MMSGQKSEILTLKRTNVAEQVKRAESIIKM